MHIGRMIGVHSAQFCAESFVCRNAVQSTKDVQANTAKVADESLIPETLESMASDTEFQQTAERLRKLGQAAITREEKQKRQRSLNKIGVPSFGAMVKVCLFFLTEIHLFTSVMVMFVACNTPSLTFLCQFIFIISICCIHAWSSLLHIQQLHATLQSVLCYLVVKHPFHTKFERHHTCMLSQGEG